jgi:hypothetical protein
MRRGRIITGALALVGAALFAVPGAYAANSKDIARDLADGRLDGTYTQAELSAYLQNATLQGYDNPVPVTPVTPTTPVTPGTPVTPATPVTPGTPTVTPPVLLPVEQPATGVAGAQSPVVTPATQPAAQPTNGVQGAQSPPLAATRTVGSLPFTGVDLLLLTVGGLLMLLLGFGARRFGRNH